MYVAGDTFEIRIDEEGSNPSGCGFDSSALLNEVLTDPSAIAALRREARRSTRGERGQFDQAQDVAPLPSSHVEESAQNLTTSAPLHMDLQAYVERVAVTQPTIRRICLIAKAKLLGMYSSCGFLVKGLSPVVHGKDPWFEMYKDLDVTAPRCLPFVQVDSFTERVFGGNPAAIFFTHLGGDAGWMQEVATEMNLSESAFLELQPKQDGKQEPLYKLRWFTPGGEVDLCGHATLAAAHALWEDGRVNEHESIRFSTASGVLVCRPKGDGWIEMDFPSEEVGNGLPPEDSTRQAVTEALGLDNSKGDGCAVDSSVLFIGRNRMDFLVEVRPEVLAELKPDMRRLAALDARGFIVTCKSVVANAGATCTEESVVSFMSRFFAPGLAIDEDPVTGSAHCCLAPYWSAAFGRDRLMGYQASARGGFVRVKCVRDHNGRISRVVVAGQATTVLHGLLKR